MGFFERIKRQLKALFLSSMFGRFIGIGFINGFNGVAFSYILSFFIPVNISFILGYFMSICVSYFLNSKFVFKHRVNVERYFKFCISYIPNFIIQKICVLITYNIFHLHQILSFTIAAIVAVPVTFLVLSLLTFKPNNKDSE